MNTKYWFVVVIVLVAMVGGYFIWANYRADDFTDYERSYLKAMKEDTYGGKTPQETLDLFIDALEKEDVELAAKYFMLDEALSRDKWVATLQQLKEKGILKEMAADLKKAKPDTNRIDENDYKFLILNEDLTIGARVNMQFNTYSRVWKIESL